MDIIKVAALSVAPSAAGAIAIELREQGPADVQAISAAAMFRAIKAIIIPRGYLQPDGLDLFFVPMLVTMQINGMERSAIRIVVEARGRTTTGRA